MNRSNNNNNNYTNMNNNKTPSYFSELKKGELIELKNLLIQSSNERDAEKTKAILQRITYYMTIGMDVSSLFPYVIMNANTIDIVVKKLVYLYITHYAKSNSSLLLLVVNTLNGDCLNSNPLIRALAVRTLCSLGSLETVEYSYKNVMRALSDPSAYVRKTAVIGLAKIYNISPTSLDLDEVLPIVFGMIMDQDALTIINAISALNEIQPDWPVSHQVVQHLLAKFKEFNEWGQCMTIETITKYTPSTEDEIIDILNLFDEKLKQSNSALILAIVKLFLKITENETSIHEQVYDRIKLPMISLMENSESAETSFSILSHIHLLNSRQPTLFQKDYKHFYCKYNDPMYIKALKIKILKEISCQENHKDILQELSEYVFEGDMKLTKKAIDAIGFISRIKSASKLITGYFCNFLQSDIETVVSYSLVAIKDFIRLYPEESSSITPLASEKLLIIEDSAAKESLIWMLGEYPNSHEETPYLVEAFIQQSYSTQPSSVKIQLLTSTLKIFFARPAETLPILKNLLIESLNLSLDPDLHDLALLYTRILKLSLEKGQKILNSNSNIGNINYFLDDENNEIRDKIFEEFNTLSIVYNKHSSTYLYKNIQQNIKDLELASIERKENLLRLEQERDVTSPSKKQQEKEKQNELLIQIEGSTQNVFDSLALEKTPELSPENFQQSWLEIQEQHKMEIQLSTLPPINEIESSLLTEGIVCLAYGSVDSYTKLYYHAKQIENGPLFLIEILIDEKSLLMTISFKSHDLKRLHSKFIPKFLLGLSKCIPNIF
ncbi:adaptor-related protein complex 4 [Tieghemostelium lacteum]|uniref:AP complex subunit beta n=1 Tax=Tieghemostelium lacteum TaxID=361077 RepID=A0A151Z8K9_TIELA|nr:adaptor-related protein complex 4 [Tieghemostelium lacteum]|eukprot:KYQ90268.1 adaptor-related protein complex 4 [Tieghemostelium lacteum]